MLSPAPMAIVAWGAVLWQGDLPRAGPWQADGPRLPLEFARISGDGRLTLVLYPQAGTPWSPTCWASAAWAPLEAVVESLRDAERCVPGQIGSLPPHPAQTMAVAAEVHTALTAWRAAQGCSAVVWTNLPPNFSARRGGEPLTPAAAVTYVRSLPADQRRQAETYVRRVPAAIQTPIRQALITELGWSPERAAGE
jgi:hypothetical protein